MILLPAVVQLLYWPQRALLLKRTFRSQCLGCRRIRRVARHLDHPWRDGMCITQQFAAAACGGARVTSGTTHAIERVAGGIDGAVAVIPITLHLDVRFVNPPGVVGWLELGADALCERGSLALNPTIAGGMVDLEAALSHHCCKITIAELDFAHWQPRCGRHNGRIRAWLLATVV